MYLVFPNWWGDLPMPVYSFLEEYDLADKDIILYVTHEGSGFSGTVDTVKDLQPKANVTEGLSIPAGNARGTRGQTTSGFCRITMKKKVVRFMVLYSFFRGYER